jgi:hypothetical protein
MKGGRKRSRPFVISHSKEGVERSVPKELAYKEGNPKITSHESLGKREHRRKRILKIIYASSKVGSDQCIHNAGMKYILNFFVNVMTLLINKPTYIDLEKITQARSCFKGNNMKRRSLTLGNTRLRQRLAFF